MVKGFYAEIRQNILEEEERSMTVYKEIYE